MTVETATQISQLNATLPLGSDPKSEGDNHLRLIKLVLQDVFNDATSGIMQLVLQHVKAGLLSSTKQGIEFDDSGNGARLRLSTDTTNALGNGLLELFDNTNVLKRTVSLKPYNAGIPAVPGNDGELLHTGNAFYAGNSAVNVDYPIGSYLFCFIAAAVQLPRNGTGVTLSYTGTAGTYAVDLGGGGTPVNGNWLPRGGVVAAGGTSSYYLMQRVS